MAHGWGPLRLADGPDLKDQANSDPEFRTRALIMGTEHLTDGPVSPEHAAASERWRQAQQDLELANEALEREHGV